jgi:ABC-2 type transport system ATP-binding protein
MTHAIAVADLVKTYGPLRAVDGISFHVEPGQIFGMLGPNGAGKSTTVEMIEGLRPADSGSIEVLGIDVRREPRRVKERIGVQLQTTAFYKELSVRQLLRLFASFFKRSLPVDDLIAAVNLEEKADTASSNLSGGQRQRLAIAAALVNDPEIIFLDEPTTGLDPQARRSLWEVISRLRAEGKTLLLTTHYLEEAERLCDRLLIIDHGKIIAAGTPAGLIAEHFERTALDFFSDDRLPLSRLEQLPGVDKAEERNGSTKLYSSNVTRTLGALLGICDEGGFELRGLSVHTATLEDVFLKLTGRNIRE